MSVLSVVSVVNRICFRCTRGFFDHENKLRICDSYRTVVYAQYGSSAPFETIIEK